VGKNSTFLQVPFLNLMANLQQRAGSVMVRVGGNTQESAKLVPDGTIPDGRVLIKNLTGVTGTTQTPPLDFSRDLLYMMRNISSLVNVHWFLGIPWFITQPFDLAIVTASQEILGDYLLGLQAGNEPDMYSIPSHGHRNATYGPPDYLGEFADLLTQVQATNADPSGQAMTKLIAPNVANFAWKTEDVVAAGLVDKFGPNLAFLAVEKYVLFPSLPSYTYDRQIPPRQLCRGLWRPWCQRHRPPIHPPALPHARRAYDAAAGLSGCDGVCPNSGEAVFDV
jgi:hypothetical protein